MSFEHLTSWRNLPVQEWTPDTTPDYAGTIYRFSYEWPTFRPVGWLGKLLGKKDDPKPRKTDMPGSLRAFASGKGAEATPALILGSAHEGGEAGAWIPLLAELAGRFPHLRALFVGDLTQEESEVSWIIQGDFTPLLAAYPHLEELRIRGGGDLELSPTRHDHLRTLIIETGGLPVSVLTALRDSSFPALEHLELWLGDDGYGWDGSPDDVAFLMEAGRFPALRHLGICNAMGGDRICEMLARAPVLGQLESLDLSRGSITDIGALTLRDSEEMRQLKKLDLSENYLSPDGIRAFQDWGPKVLAREQKDADDDGEEPSYYVSVSE